MNIRTIFFAAIFMALCVSACQENKQENSREPVTTIKPWSPYDQSEELARNAEHESARMRYRVIQSRTTDKNNVWKQVQPQIAYFSEADYNQLTPLIYERSIDDIQNAVASGDLTYEQLTQWYLYRIVKYENEKGSYLNNIISINPDAVKTARELDNDKSMGHHPIYGMPVLLKDNVNFKGLPTTAGSHVLKENDAADASITRNLKRHGAIILGKTNLSEWANYFCDGCPNGYSATGGQTLNPYGRMQFDTGGSSSGSGSAVAANYAVGAVGTETAGSITSPSSSSSLVGLKPTTGLLSRNGIVPLSGTLDTPGPMTKYVKDAAIMLSAMTGRDPEDPATAESPENIAYHKELDASFIKGKRFGYMKPFLQDSLYQLSVQKIENLGGITVEITPEPMDYTGFLVLLNADMQRDLPVYLEKYGNAVTTRSIGEIMAYNAQDTTVRAPYGQGIFSRIDTTSTTDEELETIRKNLLVNGRKFFDKPMREKDLDFILSVNNWNAGQAAAAKYPCLTVPMGYAKDGTPMGITFIGKPFTEAQLLKLGYAFEKEEKVRAAPPHYAPVVAAN